MKRQSIKADFDADAVKALIRAGAIPLAVTNVSELCMWMESYNKVQSSVNQKETLKFDSSFYFPEPIALPVCKT